MDGMAKILIVDDDEDVRKTLQLILEESGYSVVPMGTGTRAMEVAQAECYNLAMIDIKLPDMQGTDLLTKMKSGTPRMRKVIVAGNATLENTAESARRNADAYVVKPFDIDEVLTTIKGQLRMQESEAKSSWKQTTRRS